MGKRQGMHYFCRIWAQKNHPEGWLRCGAADEARTRYLHLGKVALYQMSYGRLKWCLRSESNQ